MDLNKYKYYRFTLNRKTNKQVKALLLKFDYEVERLKLDQEGQLQLVDRFLAEFREKDREFIFAFTVRKALLAQHYPMVDKYERILYRENFFERVITFFERCFA